MRCMHQAGLLFRASAEGLMHNPCIKVLTLLKHERQDDDSDCFRACRFHVGTGEQWLLFALWVHPSNPHRI